MTVIVTASSKRKGQQQSTDKWTPAQQSRGRGDTIAKATNKLGIKPCGGCKKRQDDYNEKHSYSGKQGVVNKVLQAIDKRL